MWRRRSILALIAAAWPNVAWAQLAARPASPFRPPKATAPALPLAIDGYCLVTLHDQRQWRQGDRAIAAQFDGRQYVFAGERERAIFAAAPTVYAPVLSGDCVVTFAQTGARVPGRAQFGVAHDGRLYFFSSEEARAKFAAAPAGFVDADLADQGRCLVSRVDFGRDVAGLPETAILTGGLRRLFAGAYEQSLFLQHPDHYVARSTAPDVALPATVAATGGEWHPQSGPAKNAAAGDGAATSADGSEGVADAGDGDEPAGDAKAGDAKKGAGGKDISLASEPVMGGYCPVTIQRRGVWVRGRYDDRVEVENLGFLTAGPAEREAFLADPTPFIPALGGNCAVSMVDRGEKVRGSVFHASKYQGRLYLFADAESKATFDAGPARYASIDIAAEGACVVTQVEEGRALPGFAEFAVWHDGRLYRFAGEEQKKKFLAAPEKYATAADPAATATPPAPPPPLPATASGGE